jgi:hypothetical protein
MTQPKLIVYDASDGIQNALYPYRWTVVCEDPALYKAVASAIEKSWDALPEYPHHFAFALLHEKHVESYQEYAL